MAANRTDERIVTRDNEPSQRGVPARADDDDKADEGLVLSRAERIARLKNEWQQNALPAPPETPGVHYFWASTTHGADTIHRRQKLGYTLVRKGEIPGFNIEKAQSGEYADYITCNEMVLMKIPTEHYLDALEVFHHEMPLDEEQAIRNRIEQRKDELNSKAGKEIIKSAANGAQDGIEALGNARKPKFQ